MIVPTKMGPVALDCATATLLAIGETFVGTIIDRPGQINFIEDLYNLEALP